MLRSMTSYGRSSLSGPSGDWVVEVHSVNKKQLDFYIPIPKDLLFLDLEARKLLSSYFKRGQVSVRVQFFPKKGAGSLLAHTPALKDVKEQVESICASIGCGPEGVNFPFLYELVSHGKESVAYVEEEILQKDFFSCLEEAGSICLEMKKKEGAALEKDLRFYLAALQKSLSLIEENVVGLQKKKEDKLREKLEEFAKEVSLEDKERLLREVFFYLDRTDVAEEIARLHSHIEQFLSLLGSNELVGGKTLEFLLQELSREVNTLSAKTEDIGMTRQALQMKGDLEKMKEQVQNVE